MLQGVHTSGRPGRVVASALGLSFLWPYFRASYLTCLTAYGVQPPDAVQAAYVAYVAVFLLAAVGAIACARQVERALSSAAAGPCLLACGVLGNGILWLAPGGLATTTCVAGSVLATAFFVGSVVRYGLRLGGWPARDVALVGFLSLAACFLDNAALALGAPASLAFSLAAPLLSVLCTPGAEGEADEKALARDPAKTSRTALLALMALLALFCIGGNVVRGITSPWFSYAGTTERSLYMTLANVALAAASLACLWRGCAVRKVLFWNWTLLMALFFLGLVLLAFAGGATARLGSDVATVSRVCFTLLMFLFALDARRLVSMGLTRLLGLFLLLPEALAALMRHVVVPALLAHLGADPLALASYAGVVVTFVLSAAIIVALGALLLRQVDDGQAGAEAAGEGAPPEQASPDPLDELSRTYGLTAREAESASLVSKGYSLEKTAERLGISINTVRTHMRAVYGKLGIHSRQELIDLLDERGGRP